MPRRLIAVTSPTVDQDQRGPSASGSQRRPIEPKRQREHVDHRGEAGDTRNPRHPSDLEPDEPAEGGTREQVGTAGCFEPAGDFGKRDPDQDRGKANRENEPGTPRAGLRGEHGGNGEDRSTDDLIDAKGRQVPAAEHTKQSGRRAQPSRTSRSVCITGQRSTTSTTNLPGSLAGLSTANRAG